MILELKDLRFRWRKDNADQLHIDRFTLMSNQRLFLKGASGSGKSTLLGLLAGIYRPTAGTITLLNQEVSLFSQAKRDTFRADHIGYIFQQFNLLPYLSVLENVTLACHFSLHRRKKLQGTIAQEAMRLLFALGLPTNCFDKKIGELSIGQQQRVAAARALIGKPELLLADEPTSALDANARDKFLTLLLEECAHSQTSVVFVSHDSSLAPYFDAQVELDKINRATLSYHEGCNL